MKSAFRFCRRVLVDLFFLLVAYIAAVFLLPMIKSDRQADGDADITLYLISNGIHTDIVMPSRNGDTDWTATFPAADTTGGQSADWIAVGWGDKNFYLNTPTWADLTASTALKAVSGLSESAIHTTYYDSMENCGRCAKFTVSRRQYLELAAYIRSSLKWRDGRTIPVTADIHYGESDAFYEAKGSYNLFYTCNTWTNDALKSAGAKAALWTITEGGIFRLYTP